MNLDKLIQEMKDRGFLSIEKVDAQAELDRISAEIIKNMNFIAVLMSPSHVVPVFDGQYTQLEDRPGSISVFGMAKYLYWDKVRERRN